MIVQPEPFGDLLGSLPWLVHALQLEAGQKTPDPAREKMHRIRIGSPSSRMIVLTTFKGDVQALRSFKAGATGYLLKSMVRKELVPTIRGFMAEVKS